MKKTVLLFLLGLFLLHVLASEHGSSYCFSENCVNANYRIWAEQPGKTFSPGEEMELTMELQSSEAGNTESIYIAIKFLGIEIMKQVRDWEVEVKAGETKTGYHKTIIPSFSPPGNYEIESWVVFENGKESPHDVEKVNVSMSGLFLGIGAVIAVVLALIVFFIIRAIKK